MKEILRYLGIKSEDLSPELETKIHSVKNEIISACRPKSLFYEISSVDIFNSQALYKHLSGCERYFIFAATLGTQADFIIRRYSGSDITNAAIAQAVCSWYIEKFCDDEMDKFDKGALFFKPRFSPGYADFDISYQKYILDTLNASKKIGITLTDGMMMIPEKSVTAVLGLTKEKSCMQSKCENCPNKTCEYRSI